MKFQMLFLTPSVKKHKVGMSIKTECNVECLMIIGRLFGYVCLMCMMITLGAEGLRLLEGNEDVFISIIDVFNIFEFNDVKSVNNGIETTRIPKLWQSAADYIVNFPELLAFFIAGILSIFISRDKMR